MATYSDGKLVSGPSDRHFEILASHGITDGVPDKFLPKPQQNTGGGGGLFGYKNLKDLFDGGGPGRSGARFSTGDTGDYDTNKDGYISEAEYAAAEANNPNFASTQGGIAAISNYMGARPRGSYEQERNLGQDGTNIGTSGIANYVAGGGMFGPLFGGGPNRLQQAMPNMRPDQQFTYKNLLDSGMSHDQAMEFLGMPRPSFDRSYSPRPMLRPPSYPSYSPPTVGMNMGGLMALRDYNMGMQMGMGQSV